MITRLKSYVICLGFLVIQFVLSIYETLTFTPLIGLPLVALCAVTWVWCAGRWHRAFYG